MTKGLTNKKLMALIFYVFRTNFRRTFEILERIQTPDLLDVDDEDLDNYLQQIDF